MGSGRPPGASPKRAQHHPTKADFPGPFNGFQMTIHAALQACKRTQNGKPSSPGIACGKPQHPALLPHISLKLLQVQMFWHSTSLYGSRKRHWQCSYGPARMASMPSYTRHVCPLCCPHFAAVSLDTRQPNTSSSIAAIFQQPDRPLETTRGIYQTLNSSSPPQQAYRKSPNR
jgi:hypothetical protein